MVMETPSTWSGRLMGCQLGVQRSLPVLELSFALGVLLLPDRLAGGFLRGGSGVFGGFELGDHIVRGTRRVSVTITSEIDVGTRLDIRQPG
jgi:hypothetical protein